MKLYIENPEPEDEAVSVELSLTEQEYEIMNHAVSSGSEKESETLAIELFSLIRNRCAKSGLGAEDVIRVQHTFQIQRSHKWVNFTVEVEASSQEEALIKSYDVPFSEWSASAGDIGEVDSLEDIFHGCKKWTSAMDGEP